MKGQLRHYYFTDKKEQDKNAFKFNLIDQILFGILFLYFFVILFFCITWGIQATFFETLHIKSSEEFLEQKISEHL